MSLETDLEEIVRRVVREERGRSGQRAPPPDPLDYLTPEGIAELLKLTVDTVRDLLAAKKLPGMKLNGKWRTRRIDLERHLAGLSSGPAATDTTPDPRQVGAALARDMRGTKKAG